MNMADKAEIEYWITKLPTHQLKDLLNSIRNEINNRQNMRK